MAKNETTAGAEHVLAHGTARTRAAAEPPPSHEASKAKGKKRIKRMVIEPADDGSHVIRHEHHPPEEAPGEIGMAAHHPDETYTAPDMEGLHAHIEQHLGAGNPGEEEGEGAEEQAAEEQMAEHPSEA